MRIVRNVQMRTVDGPHLFNFKSSVPHIRMCASEIIIQYFQVSLFLTQMQGGLERQEL